MKLKLCLAESLWIQSSSSSVAIDKTGKEICGKCPPLYGEGLWIQSPSSSVVTDKTGKEICGKCPPYRRSGYWMYFLLLRKKTVAAPISDLV
ncbi:hypothetical protein ACROYT_G020937 [Oculina patagonica]